MVQRPFSDTGGGQALTWTNSSGLQQMREAITLPGFAHINAVIHKMQRPKMSTILSSVETNRGKSAYNKINSGTEHVNELRLARNTFSNISVTASPFMVKDALPPRANNLQSNNNPKNIAIDTYYAIPTLSKFFPPVDDQEFQSIELKTNSRENTIIFPDVPEVRENQTVVVKGIFLANKNNSEKLDEMQVLKTSLVDKETESDKADYFLQGTPVDAGVMYSYNSSANPYSCLSIKAAKAEIDAQELFASFDIEVCWYLHLFFKALVSFIFLYVSMIILLSASMGKSKALLEWFIR